MKKIFHIFLTCILVLSLPAQGMARLESQALRGAASPLSRQQSSAFLKTKTAVSATAKAETRTFSKRSDLPSLKRIASEQRHQSYNSSMFKRAVAGMVALGGVCGHKEICAQELTTNDYLEEIPSSDAEKISESETIKALKNKCSLFLKKCKLWLYKQYSSLLEEYKLLLKKYRLWRLEDDHPEKIAAKEELVAYIQAAQADNSITDVCNGLHTYYYLFSKTILLNHPTECTATQDLTPTVAHLYATPNPCRNQYVHNKILNNMIKRVVELEKSSSTEQEPYYSYVHAHRWEFDLAQRIYAELYPSKNKEFFPLYFLTLNNPPQPNLNKVLQEKGNAGYNSVTEGEKYLLSVNASFFGNSRNIGESTSYYFLNDLSIRPPNLSLQKLFSSFGHKDVYVKYASEFKRLERLHSISSPYGKLWLIKIPKKVHQQVVIPTQPLGYKTEFLVDGNETDDVNLIQDTLRTRPQTIADVDKMQFRILMTPSTGLNPDLGIKTIPLHCADPEKYATFEKALDALMTKVKADIATNKEMLRS